jgi:hypothetical protein
VQLPFTQRSEAAHCVSLHRGVAYALEAAAAVVLVRLEVGAPDAGAEGARRAAGAHALPRGAVRLGREAVAVAEPAAAAAVGRVGLQVRAGAEAAVLAGGAVLPGYEGVCCCTCEQRERGQLEG